RETGSTLKAGRREEGLRGRVKQLSEIAWRVFHVAASEQNTIAWKQGRRGRFSEQERGGGGRKIALQRVKEIGLVPLALELAPSEQNATVCKQGRRGIFPPEEHRRGER